MKNSSLRHKSKTTHVPNRFSRGGTGAELLGTEELYAMLKAIPGISKEKCQMLLKHWQMMVASDDYSDLTRLVKSDEIAQKHYLDCALVLKHIQLKSPILDIGTGAGFPGLVLKILAPELELILGEPRPKRVKFLTDVIDVLELKNISVFSHRIGPAFSQSVNTVITRALESARDTLYRVRRFLPTGGRVVLLKGPNGHLEIGEALKEFPDFKHVETFHDHLIDQNQKREIIVFERTTERIDQLESTRGELFITSVANARFQTYKSLSENKAIKKNQQFILSGKKMVHEVLDGATHYSMSEILFSEGFFKTPESADLRKMIPAEVQVVVLADGLFKEVDFFGTAYPLLVIRLPDAQENNSIDASRVHVVLPFQDPANIGTALRSCAAFNVTHVSILPSAANPYSPKAIRAGANAQGVLHITSASSLDSIASEEAVVALDKNGTSIHEFQFPEKFILLPGLEGTGLTHLFSDQHTSNSEKKIYKISIPISERVESLNAQTALSILLYELQRRNIL